MSFRSSTACSVVNDLSRPLGGAVSGTFAVSTTSGTIQGALEQARSLHAGDVTINVAPGRYKETLRLTSFSAATSDQVLTAPRRGLNVIGDTRPVVGVTYLHGGNAYNPNGFAGLGTNYAAVTLSNVANAITVTGPTDFVAAGVVANDTILIRDNTLAWTRTTVQSVAGNVITHNGGTLAVGNNATAVVICPNVEIVGLVAAQPILTMENCAAHFLGIWFNSTVADTSTANLSAIAAIGASTLLASNCIFDARVNGVSSLCLDVLRNSMFSGFRYGQLDSNIPGSGFPGVNSFFASSPGVFCINIEDYSVAHMGHATCIENGTLDSTAVFVGTAGKLRSDLMQISGGGVTVTSETTVILSRLRMYNAPVTSMLCLSDAYVEIGTPAFTSTVDAASAPGTTALSISRFARLRVTGPLQISNVSDGIVCSRSGSLQQNSDSPVTFTGAVTNQTAVDSTSSYDNVRALPGNVNDYAVVGTQPFSAHYTVNTISAAGIARVQWSPNTTVASTPASVGKLYSFTSRSNNAHRVELLPADGSVFVRQGLANTTIAEFGAINSYLVVQVLPNQTVLVVAQSGITFIP